MKICGECREEYVEHVAICHHCKVPLLSPEELAKSGKLHGKKMREVEAESAKGLLEGSLASCREVERILKKSMLPCLVYPLSLCADHNATLGTSCSTNYVVLVNESDIEDCKNALLGHFQEDVSREGQGTFVSDVIDLSNDEVQCPACGERGALLEGACAECGLFLGIRE
jgi:hypothetical protein